MNLIEFNHIPYKHKKLVVSTICAMYSVVEKTRAPIEEVLVQSHELNDAVQMSLSPNVKTRSLFSALLALLAEPHRKIIETEFLNTEVSNSLWYLAHWSKSAYYKLKHEAIDQFLLLLYV